MSVNTAISVDLFMMPTVGIFSNHFQYYGSLLCYKNKKVFFDCTNWIVEKIRICMCIFFVTHGMVEFKLSNIFTDFI